MHKKKFKKKVNQKISENKKNRMGGEVMPHLFSFYLFCQR